MKAEQRTVYVARDGRDFPTVGQCRAHERETCGAALVGLTAAQVEAARTGADPELAEAFEMFGYDLRKARQSAGQLKRRRHPNGPNNPEHNAGPPLSDHAGMGSAGDSPAGTESERAVGVA
jgi:hypothetical protein